MMEHQIKPTDSELEILNVLWDKHTASVRQVHEELIKSKEAGYTTTLKLLQIMFEKGLVTRNDSAKTHFYTPAFSKESTQKQLLNKIIKNVFGGNSAQLVLQALGNNHSSEKELNAIQELLDLLKKGK
jgi:hypothetical protein